MTDSHLSLTDEAKPIIAIPINISTKKDLQVETHREIDQFI